jgi:hypothetical protein
MKDALACPEVPDVDARLFGDAQIFLAVHRCFVHAKSSNREVFSESELEVLEAVVQPSARSSAVSLSLSAIRTNSTKKETAPPLLQTETTTCGKGVTSKISSSNVSADL